MEITSPPASQHLGVGSAGGGGATTTATATAPRKKDSANGPDAKENLW